MKVVVEREVLHQMARRVAGNQEHGLCNVTLQKMADAGRNIAAATASRDSGPFELVVVE